MTLLANDELDRLLGEVGALLDTGEEADDAVDLSAADLPQAQPETSRRLNTGRRLARVAVAAIVVLGAGTLLAIAPAREAIADWFGIGSTTVQVPIGTVPPPDPALPALGDEAPPVTVEPSSELVETASPVELGSAALGRPLPSLAGEEPAEVVVPEEGGVLLIYTDPEITLWVRRSGLPGSAVGKRGAADAIRFVTGLGDGEALLLGNDHTLTTPGRTLRSGPVVLWTADGLELRIEGQLGDEALIALARRIEVPVE